VLPISSTVPPRAHKIRAINVGIAQRLSRGVDDPTRLRSAMTPAFCRPGALQVWQQKTTSAEGRDHSVKRKAQALVGRMAPERAILAAYQC